MKRLLPSILLLLLACPIHAATWYATSSSVNINAASLWVPTSTGSCTGSGTALSWGSQANGDVFDANGCTSLAVNVDPGTATGASAGNCGSVTVTVTLQTNATNGGGFTYATATNIVMHSNLTVTKTTALVVTGSTGGGTVCGNLTGGSTATTYAASDSHSTVTMYYIGTLTAGSASGANGLYLTGTGPTTITGSAYGEGNSNAFGIDVNGTGVATMTGTCYASTTTQSPGCLSGSSATHFTLIGNIINSLTASGQYGNILYTPGSTGYVLFPKDTSYTFNTINSHSTLMPVDPGSTNVKSGVVYGPNTGSYGGASSVCTVDGW